MKDLIKLRLDKRLKTIADYVRIDKRIADIGTDHAIVPCFLWRKGAKEIFASDISEGPLLRAKATAASYGIEGIRFILCDGLSEIPPVDDVIIAGMGGETIADILSGCVFLNKDMRFILQPMTKSHVLRRSLYRMGFEILEEKAVLVSKKIYSVMLCGYTENKTEIDDAFAFVGKNEDKEYIKSVVSRLDKMAKGSDEKYTEIKNKILESAFKGYS